MKILEIVTSIHNWLSDKDFIWWPFSFLRPNNHEPITYKLTMLMTLCFGGLSFLMFTALAIANNAFSLENAFTTFIFCFGGFFFWFNLITKPLWNRRSQKLKK